MKATRTTASTLIPTRAAAAGQPSARDRVECRDPNGEPA